MADRQSASVTSTEANTSLVRYESAGAVALLTLANPTRRNALSSAVLSELRGHLQTIAADVSIKCVVLRSTGPVFSSGHDLREVAAAAPADATRLFTLCSEVMEAIRLLPQPVIAAVQGIATAAGCQLALACDLVVAADSATFATPGVNIGLFCSTPAVPLVRAVPTKKAAEMLFTGEALSAAEAERLGMINRVVPHAELDGAAVALAQQIAKASGEVLRLGKRALYAQLPLSTADAYRVAEQAMVENSQLSDAHEGITAFLEKRPPIFQD